MIDDLAKQMIVKCDEPGCGWSQEIKPSTIEDWHNKPCPECGDGVIVNDEDLSVFYAMASIAMMGRAIYPGQKPKSYVRINTECLRTKPDPD